MMTRRQFTKTIGATAALAAAHPGSIWSVKASPAFSPIPDLTPARVSPAAAEQYRRAFVLDANTLAGIGFPISDDDPAGVTKLIIGSGVNVVKATLGGAQGNFEQAVAAIAKAELLMEKQTDAFFKVDKVADFDRAKREGKVGVIYSFESAAMLEDKLERIEIFRGRGVRVMQLTYNRKTPFGCGCLDGENDGLTSLGRDAVAKMNELGVGHEATLSNLVQISAKSTDSAFITDSGYVRRPAISGSAVIERLELFLAVATAQRSKTFNQGRAGFYCVPRKAVHVKNVQNVL